MMKNMKSGTFEVDTDNIQAITKDQLKDAEKPSLKLT
jgi:hypothetical protein